MEKQTFEIERKAKEVLSILKEEAKTAKSWAWWSNRMSQQDVGVIALYFPDLLERQAFYDTPEYEELTRIRRSLMKKFGTIEGADPDP